MAARFTPGFGYEFLQRDDGYAGLTKAYGLTFGNTPRGMDLSLIYRALSEKQVDVIAGPVSPTVAWNIGEISDDPVKNYLADVYTLPASLAGLPAMSLPVGFGDQGRPVGMQLIADYFGEARLLNVAHQFQLHTDWHLQCPED